MKFFITQLINSRFCVAIIIIGLISFVSHFGLYSSKRRRALSVYNPTYNPFLRGDLTDVDKGPILEILHRAGVKLDKKTISRLPTQSHIEQLYGSRPIFRGLRSCAAFRDANRDTEIIILSSGLFNAGTTLLKRTVKSNCRIRGEVRNEIWWKHSPAQWAHKDEYLMSERRPNFPFQVKPVKYDDNNHDYYKNVLVVVSIKDPLFWMLSMCSKPYSARMNATERHCPNLRPEQNMPGYDLEPDVDVFAKYPQERYYQLHYRSLVEYWNQFNYDYFKAPFPHIMIRYEDLLLHTEEVTRRICECAGGTMNKELIRVVNPIKEAGMKEATVGPAKGLVEALVRYGDPKKRLEGFTEADLQYVRETLNVDLMNEFHYIIP